MNVTAARTDAAGTIVITLDADAIISRVMKRIPVPDKPLAPETAGHGQG